MDTLTKEQRSSLMSRIRSESSIERIPSELEGLYLRRHPRMFGNPDFGNKRRKIALFIDGCFWHGCRLHYKAPKSNQDYWREKIRRNKKRDKEVTKRLGEMGYLVVRVWECQMN